MAGSLHDFGQRLFGGIRHLGAVPDRLDGVFNQVRGVLCGLRALARKVADLVRDDGEALARFARAGGLYGGVQREDVGLEGDVVDGLDDVADLLGGLADVLHRLGHLGHFHAGVFELFLLFGRSAVGLGGIVGVFLHVRRNLGDGRRQLLNRAGLLRRALGQGLRPARHLVGAAGGLVGGFPHVEGERRERLADMVQRRPDFSPFALPLIVRVVRQVL